MAKHDRDPALRALVRSVEESAEAAVPVTLTVRGSVLEGRLVGQRRYFAELAGRHPMMNVLDPAAGLAGDDKGYTRDMDAESGYYLHLLDAGLVRDRAAEGGPWRIRLSAVDGWGLAPAFDEEGKHKGPLAGIMGGTR